MVKYPLIYSNVRWMLILRFGSFNSIYKKCSQKKQPNRIEILNQPEMSAGFPEDSRVFNWVFFSQPSLDTWIEVNKLRRAGNPGKLNLGHIFIVYNIIDVGKNKVPGFSPQKVERYIFFLIFIPKVTINVNSTLILHCFGLRFRTFRQITKLEPILHRGFV